MLAPQALQKLPDAWAPHAGQGREVGSVMWQKRKRVTLSGKREAVSQESGISN